MRRSLKWFRNAIVGVAVTVLLAVIVAAFTLSTQTGTRWALNLVDASIPGEIVVERFEGTLWVGLHIPLFIYRDPEQEIHASAVDLELNWSSVLAGQLIVNDTGAESIEYRSLVATESAPGPFELAMDPLPLTVGIVRSRIGRIAMTGSAETTEIRELLLDSIVMDGNALAAKAVSATFENVTLSVSDLDATLTGDIPLSLSIAWSLADNSWSGSGSFDGSLAALGFDHAVLGDYPAALSGELKLLNRIEPEIDAQVSWERWSYNEYVIENGEVQVRGTIQEYDASYDLTAQLPAGETLQLSGTATGNTEKLSAFDANISSLTGNANLVGSVSWQPEIIAEVQVLASDFDPSIVVEELTGRLNAEAYVRVDGNGNVNISDTNITGTLNGAPVDAGGTVSISPEQLNCDKCLVAVGDNRVSIDGTSSSSRLALTWSVDAPSLDLLWPGIGGNLNGQGQLEGSMALPQFTGEIHGQNLRAADWSAAEVVIISQESSADAIDLQATVTSLLNADSDIGTLTLVGKGAAEMLELEIDWAFRSLEISAAGNLRQQDDLFTGAVRRAIISEINTGSWSLSSQPEFQYSAGDLSIDAHAWSSTSGQFRVSQISRVDDVLTLTANLVGLPLPMANSFLPADVQLQGSASADIDVVQESGLWAGAINWRQAGTIVNLLESDGQLTAIPIPRAELDIELKGAGASMSAVLTVEPGVTGELDLAIDRFAGDSPIVAEMRLQGSEWNWVPAVIPAIDKFEGDVSATVRATGPLAAPEFGGDLNWQTGSLEIPALNIPVTEIDLTVSGTSEGAATLSGSAKAGEGDLRITGRFEELTQPTRSVRLTLNGESAELVNWPEYHLWASPDLVVTGTAAGWTINGELEVPRADMVIRELPEETVKLSPDVIVIGREEAAQTPIPVSGEAKLLLGDQVQFQAFGLDTGLQGELQLRLANDRPISAEGQVELVGGTFSAYGQKLTIQQGTLTFTGPLDNPLVDVRAVRTIEAFDGPVTAGIHLQGRAQTINSTVFSDPAMSEADTLSYLVVGRPLNQASESEGNELSNAAAALGVKQATRITEQIGQALGLDQLSLAGDGGDTTSLVAGKQVNSRLHARYAYGVFSRLGTLLLRYKMSRRLTLEAGAGEIQSINVLYLVEKQ